ncbi:MAG: hypothetical protein K0M45_05620 [Candidatus Paracaedibacteraceae bacterium]|nr:hypothetical protein [Candidatus Paracaedibacteraceae bacterium]
MITINSNQLMKKLLFKADWTTMKFCLSNSFFSLLEKGFIYKDGCLLLLENFHKAKVLNGDFVDRTGYECFVNKIHVEDYIPISNTIPIEQIYLCGLFFLSKTVEKINLLSFKGLYRFILSIDQDEEDSTLNSYVFRFHTLRQGEEYLEENLDLYESSILVMDIDTNQLNKNFSSKDLLRSIEDLHL